MKVLSVEAASIETEGSINSSADPITRQSLAHVCIHHGAEYPQPPGTSRCPAAAEMEDILCGTERSP